MNLLPVRHLCEVSEKTAPFVSPVVRIYDGQRDYFKHGFGIRMFAGKQTDAPVNAPELFVVYLNVNV